MKQIIGLFILLIGLMAFTSYLMKNENASQLFGRIGNFPVAQPGPAAIGPDEIQIGDNRFKAEIVSTELDRRVGLTKYDSLPQDRGMLFVFSKKDVEPAFWMKDMKFSIDIIWINDNKVVQIHKEVPPPPPNTQEANLTRYEPIQRVDYVFEVATGVADKNGIKPGDMVILPSTLESGR